MIILSGLFTADGDMYGEMMGNMKKSAEKVGYEVLVKNIEDDPTKFLTYFGNLRLCCYFKPKLILETLEERTDDIVWLDSDCLVKSRFDELLTDCDLAVTLRRGKGERAIYDGYINAGVMAFRNNEYVKAFIRKWIDNLEGSFSDQDAMNKLLLKFTNMNEYGIVKMGDVLVNIAPCDVYNFIYHGENHSKAKIIHVKGSQREDFYDKYVQEVL